MRFAVISNEGTSLVYWMRLQDEGNDVRVWIAPRSERNIGDGLVKKFGSFEALAAWGQEKPTVFIFDCTGQGDKADYLRKRGHLVVGGGSFMDKLEMDRVYGGRLSKEAGVVEPETQEHNSLSDSIKWLTKNDDGRGWYFKTDKYLDSDATQGADSVEQMVRYLEFMKTKYGDRIPNILQEKIKGVALSTACYWNGRAWLPPYEGTIEHKKFMDGDVGPSTGCSFNIIWFYDNFPRICKELQWEKVGEIFRKEEAPPGLYDINAQVGNDGKAYFLEWTPRFGYDSEPTAQRALTIPMGEFFYGLATGTLTEAPFDTSVVQMSVRLSVSPYPWERVEDIPNKKSCIGKPIWGNDGLWDGNFIGYGLGLDDEKNLVVKTATGLVGLAATSGTDLEEMNDEILDFVRSELEIPGLQYRTDADKVIGKDVDALRKLGYEIPLVTTPESK